MRKIFEIDAADIYSKTQLMPWQSNPKYSSAKTRHRLDKYWFEYTFTPAQQQILNKLYYTARPHPKHNPTVEIFIDDELCTEQDWTMIHLMFNRPRC